MGAAAGGAEEGTDGYQAVAYAAIGIADEMPFVGAVAAAPGGGSGAGRA